MRDVEKYNSAKRLRDSGMTFREIGEELSVSASRAAQLVAFVERKERMAEFLKELPKPAAFAPPRNELDGLPKKVQAVLHEEEVSTVVGVKDILQSGRFKRLPTVGKATVRIVELWLKTKAD